MTEAGARIAESASVLAQAQARRASALAGSVVLIALVLLALGIVMVYSSSAVPAAEAQGDPSYFLGRQVLWVALGLALFAAAARLPYRWWSPLALLALGASLAALALVLWSPLGVEVNHARRWLQVAGWRFEPSEALKVSLVLYLAARLGGRGDRARPEAPRFAPAIVATGLACALLMGEPDFGTSVLLGLVTTGILFLAGLRKRILVATGLVVAAGIVAGIVTSPYRLARVEAFLDPWADAQGTGYQVVQSLIAFGSGGMFGRGLGFGLQKLGYIPNAHTDFVMSIVGEELGFLGVGSVTALYALLVVQGMRIAMRASDRFGRMLAASLTLLIGTQVMINLWMTLALLPTKGMPLPLMSYGGSALLADAAAVGILVSIARRSGPAWLGRVAGATGGTAVG